MSYPESEKVYKYPNNFLVVQEDEEIRRQMEVDDDESLNQSGSESSDSTDTITQNMEVSNDYNPSVSSATITQNMEVNNDSHPSCNNCNNNDYKRLRLYFIILVVLFLLSLLGITILHIDRKTIIEQNSKILAEYKHHQRLYNNHIDNTIGYIQHLIDLLIKTQGSLSKLKFEVTFDQNYVPDVVIL
jgi:hypothetical protein